MSTQIANLKHCTWDARTKRLKLSSEFAGMPSSIKIRSDKTNRVIEFVSLSPCDPLYDEDQWDGEQKIYRPTESCNVDHLVIFNEW